MENIGIICGIGGIVLGLFGAIFSAVQFFHQRKQDKLTLERAIAQEKHALEQEQHALEQEQKALERAAEQEQKALERAIEQEKKLDLQTRLAFLMQVIIDKDIPRESRQPFYDEYVAKGGNGTILKFWLENRESKS